MSLSLIDVAIKRENLLKGENLKMRSREKVVVLLSGGVDSATCLAIAVKKSGRENVYALNMYYEQKHEKEIVCARAIAEYYRVSYFEMDVSTAMQFSDCPLLKGSKKEIKHQSYAGQLKELDGKRPVDTYVPFRNGLFLSAATAFALSVRANTVMYGAHADDAVGNAYPDCSVAFASAMRKAIREGSGGQVDLWVPLIRLNKSEVVSKGLKLEVPYQLTWSCYEGGEKPCGKCGTCIDRAKAFANNNVADPALNGDENNEKDR